MQKGSDITAELEEHQKSCKACQEWLANEISTAPSGVSEADWENAVSKCFPDKVEDTVKKQNTEKENIVDSNSEVQTEDKPELKENGEPKTFMDYYMSGLKYGLVFGLAVVIGFAIIQNKNEAAEEESKKAVTQEEVKNVNEGLASESVDVEKSYQLLAIGCQPDLLINLLSSL